MDRKWTTAAMSATAATVVFAAAALAQTPSPGPTGTPGVGVTPSGTGAVSTGTVTAGTGTITAGTGTPVANGTAQATGTVQVFPTTVVSPSLYVPGGQGNFAYANPAFKRVWDRTDRPVAEGKVARTWFWGPGPNSTGLLEAYKEDPTGRGQRLVQYFDKSRMEVNNPSADSSQPFFVTNGLLTVELISGFVQVGEKDFTQFRPACIPMSGDFGDSTAPTYAAFKDVSNTQAGDHPATTMLGKRATLTIDRNGKVGEDTSKGTITGTDFVYFDTTTKHNIPSVFWNFLNSKGPVYTASGQVATEQLITPWFYASGLPISEPYWAKAKIRGTLTDVLIQAFERRALTYVPTNQGGFQVEMANIGQHYFDWRYRNVGICSGGTAGTPTPPVPAPTGTQVSGTTTPGATGTPGTPRPTTTGTVTPGTATAQPSETVTAVVTIPNPGIDKTPTAGIGTPSPQPIPVTPTP